MKVLSTKLLTSDVIAYANSFDLNVQCIDFIEVHEVAFDLKSINQNQFDSIVFTSSNGVNYFLQQKNAIEIVKNINVFSLGGKTNDALIAHAIQANIIAKDSYELADLIIESGISKSILHACGNLALNILEEKFKAASIAYNPLVVYQTDLLKHNLLSEQFDAILFFSPSGVESFFAENKLNTETVCCCIGNTTAYRLLKQSDAEVKIIVADNSSPQSMINALVHHYKTQKEIL